MTALVLDRNEIVRLWKDPEARWEAGLADLPVNPAGEIEITGRATGGSQSMNLLGVVEAHSGGALRFAGTPSVGMAYSCR